MKDILGLDFLKICRKYRSNGVLFPEIHYICRANRCVCMQPLAEKCFSLNRRDWTKSPKKSNSSLKVLGISTPCFVYPRALSVSKVYTSQCERCFYLPPL